MITATVIIIVLIMVLIIVLIIVLIVPMNSAFCVPGTGLGAVHALPLVPNAQSCAVITFIINYLNRLTPRIKPEETNL